MVTTRADWGYLRMSLPLRTFMESYVNALLEGNAAVFAGAGLSASSGFVDWRTLLRPLAADIGLSMDEENDFLAVAQYYENSYGRGRINQLLLDEFGKKAEPSENHRLLAALPIRSYWTTNYDTLIEDALRSAGKSVDVKIRSENLALTVSGYDAVVHKMHGDISALDRAVLTKNDFETFNDSRRMFTTTLENDLASKTFLFLGFSFTDRNLDYVLNRMKTMLGPNVRPHYCLMRKERRSSYKSWKEYRCALIRQKLKIRDLVRYGIHVVLVNEYAEITQILRTLRVLVRRRCVFVSGSAATYEGWDEERARNLGLLLGQALVREGFQVATGFGLGVGDSLIRGALRETSQARSHSRYPLHLGCVPDPTAKDSEWSAYRSDMLQRAGISVFLFGNKQDESGKLVESTGMIEEFEIGNNLGVVPVPVGATGAGGTVQMAAETLWKQVMDDFDTYVRHPELNDDYQKLGDQSLSNDQIVETVLKITMALASAWED